MAHADAHERMAELRAAFQEYQARPIPRLGRLADLAAGADVDLFEEDAYLAGLVSVALAGAPIRVDVIVLDVLPTHVIDS